MGVGEPMLRPCDYRDALLSILLCALRDCFCCCVFVGRATAVSPLSAFGWKGRLSVTSVLELDGDVSLSLLMILFFSFSVSVQCVHDIDFIYTPLLFCRP